MAGFYFVLLPALFYLSRFSVARSGNDENKAFTLNSVRGEKCGQAWTRLIYKTRKTSNESALRYLGLDDPFKVDTTLPFLFNKKFIRDAYSLPFSDYVTLTSKQLDDYVIATAADFVYGHVALKAIATIQRHLPGRHIVFYDLGLYDYELENRFKALCDVEYRKFNFSRYPSHVLDLDLYAWKPLIIQELLKEHAGVFWMDSSIRLQGSIPNEVFNKVVRSGGLLTFSLAGHSVWSTTHQGMYRYLAPSRGMQGLVAADMVEANSLLVYRTQDAYCNVIGWWILCALERRCIAPSTVKRCDVRSRNEFAGCHRFDQSALNILLVNHYKHNSDKYLYYRSDTFLKVARSSFSQENVPFKIRPSSFVLSQPPASGISCGGNYVLAESDSENKWHIVQTAS